MNTTGKNLDLRNGAVSASLLKAGGNSIQQELSKNYPQGLGDGEIAVSVGGNLKCRHVLHGSLMNWDGGDKAVQVKYVASFSKVPSTVHTNLLVTYILTHLSEDVGV